MRFLIRAKAAIHAFKHAKVPPYYAVIYDGFEGNPEDGMLVSEEYYESFGCPSQANKMFREAYPKDLVTKNGVTYGNARLVMVLGDISDYDWGEE